MVEPLGLYNPVVMDHFNHPRNMGEMETPDGVGEATNPVCGDTMRLFIKVDKNRIVKVTFLTFGCGATIAASSIVDRNDQREEPRRSSQHLGSRYRPSPRRTPTHEGPLFGLGRKGSPSRCSRLPREEGESGMIGREKALRLLKRVVQTLGPIRQKPFCSPKTRR